MATELDLRQQTILAALGREIERQAGTDLEQIDLVQMARAIDAALDGRSLDAEAPGDGYDDGKEPDELNAANDG
jgi:hypothetical protein